MTFLVLLRFGIEHFGDLPRLFGPNIGGRRGGRLILELILTVCYLHLLLVSPKSRETHLLKGEKPYPVAGRVKVKIAPLFPGAELFLAWMVPPCASIIFLEMNRPSPVPLADREANFEKSIGKI